MEKSFKYLVSLIPKEILKPVLLDSSFLVGGAVRDFLFNLEPKDFDIVVERKYFKDVLSYFSKNGFKFIHLNPLAFPLLRVFYKDKTYDFTVYDDLESDLMHRDFTINAIYVNLSNVNFISHASSFFDLENRILNVVSANSIKIDPVRYMRAFRFIANFNLTVEDKTRQILLEDAKLYLRSKKERAREELFKFISLDYETIEKSLSRVYKGFTLKGKERIHLAFPIEEFRREVNIGITYLDLLKLYFVSLDLEDFTYGLSKKEHLILSFLRKDIKEDFDELFEVYFENRAKAVYILLNIVANYPLEKISKYLSLLRAFVNTKVDFYEIVGLKNTKKVDIALAHKLVLKEKLRKVYENIFSS